MILTHCDWCGTVERPEAKIKAARAAQKEYVAYIGYEYPKAYDLCPVCFGALKALIATARERGIAQGDLTLPKPPPTKIKTWTEKIFGKEKS